MFGLRSKLAACVIGLTVVGLAGTHGLCVSLFKEAYRNTTISLMAMVSQRIGQNIETRLNLGLPLPALRQIQRVLADEKQRLRNVQSIIVCDHNGQIVFSSAPLEIGEMVPTDLLQQAIEAGERPWTADRESLLQVGVRIDSAYGTFAGAVVTRLPLAVIDQTVQRFALMAGACCLAALAAVAAIVLAALYLVPWRFRAELTALSNGIGALAGEPEPVSPAAAVPALVRRDYARFVERMQARAALIDEIDKQITRLDETA